MAARPARFFAPRPGNQAARRVSVRRGAVRRGPRRSAGQLVRDTFRGLDPILVGVTGALVGVGLLMVCSSSFVYARDTFGDGLFFLKRQAAFALLGTLLLVLFAKLPYRLWGKLAWPLLIVSYATLLALFIPGLGLSAGGARRWLALPFVTFEPSEFAKLALVIFFAHYLAEKGERIGDFKRGLLPLLAVAAAFVALIMRQPDLGTCITLGLVTMVMLFVGGARLSHLTALSAAGLPLLAVAIFSADYRMRRVFAFLWPWDDPLGNGFQIIHSFLAFGSGGLLGQGAGAGLQKLWYLPQSHTDFIFSVLAEELGLVGVIGVLALFATLIIRGLKLGARLEDHFGYYLAVGLTLLVGVQAIFNIGVVMGLLPTKGLTLPFISYGGSSLALNMVTVGMLLNVTAPRAR